MERGVSRADAEKAAAKAYHTPFLTCPAALSVETARNEKRGTAEDVTERDAGRDPESWRTWLTWTDAEGSPDFSEEG